jgi:hypothetical protein
VFFHFTGLALKEKSQGRAMNSNDQRNWMELNLSAEQEAKVREAATLYKTLHLDTIDNVFKIAVGIQILRKEHSRSGVRGKFEQALVQYGFIDRSGKAVHKSIRSDYTALLEHEQDVRAWWKTADERKRRFWLSARAIHRHWKVSRKPKDPDAPRKPTPLQQERATNVILQEQLHEANARLQVDGNQFDLAKTGAETIGKIIVNTWRTQPSRIETLIRTLNAELKELRALTKAARPVQRKRGNKAAEKQPS